MFSGCQDEQTSADVHDVAKFGLPDATGAGGACTNAILVNLVRCGEYCSMVDILSRRTYLYIEV